jgi:hypothetical protein
MPDYSDSRVGVGWVVGDPPGGCGFLTYSITVSLGFVLLG